MSEFTRFELFKNEYILGKYHKEGKSRRGRDFRSISQLIYVTQSKKQERPF